MLCAASGIVRSKPGLGCVWVPVSHVEAWSVRGGPGCCCSPSRCSDVESTFLEAAVCSGCSGPRPVRANGGNGSRCRLAQCTGVREADGARGAARLQSRFVSAHFRGFSRTASLRVADGIKRVSPVNERVSRKWGPLTRRARGGRNRPDGQYGVGRNRSRVACNARWSRSAE